MRDGLMRLMARNRGRGFVRAEQGAGKKTIYLYDVIAGTDEEAEWWGGVGPGAFVRDVVAARGSPLEIRVNSPGGSVFGARAMAAVLAEHDSAVTVVVDGLAASAASFLVQAAGRVEMAEGAMLMIHKAWTYSIGNAADLRAEADVLDKIDGQIAATYAQAAAARGVEAPDFAALMAAESWLTADEAIAAGLADGKVETLKGRQAAIRWDLSAFANAPEAEAEPEEAAEAEAAGAVTVDVQPSPLFVAAVDHSDEIERRRRLARAYAVQAA